MWPFTGRGKQKSGLTDLVDDRGLLDLSVNDQVIRCWIPESGETAMKEVSTQTGMTATKYLREFLVVHLYGMHELLKMQEEKTGLYYEPPPVPYVDDPHRIKRSRAPAVECIPGLGKNIVPLKIRLPKRIKDDLQLLADRVGVPLSQFIREILISHFFGQAFWPERLQRWTKEQEHIATEWEQGRREAEAFRYSQNRPEEVNGDRVVDRL